MTMPNLSENLNSLGSGNTAYATEPSQSILETFPNPKAGDDGPSYAIRFSSNEFTSLCPKTGQPDYAVYTIEYHPDEVCIESKSLKLYMGSYRNVGAFMEQITNRIKDDLVAVCKPRSMTVRMEFAARGGIDTTVEAVYSAVGEKMLANARRFSEMFKEAADDISGGVAAGQRPYGTRPPSPNQDVPDHVANPRGSN